MSRLRPKVSSPTRAPLYARSKGKVVDVERKENTYVGAKTDSERKRSPPILAQRSGHEIINVNVKYSKKNEPIKTTSRTRYLTENEPKPKTLSTKRRNILAIRKPNASKTRLEGVVKSKSSRRSVDDTDSARSSIAPKLSKRSFSRNQRGGSRISALGSKAIGSSSSDDMIGGSWEEVGTILGSQSGISHAESLTMAGKRRSFPNQSPARLKKIRLKTGL